MSHAILDLARRIHAERYPRADVVLAAGSIVRGEGTPFSDLDLVVVHREIDHAYRESFRFDHVPVEAFVHDPSTLEYFFREIDGPSGVPTLPQMVLEGVEIPAPTATSRAVKERAAAVIEAGPAALDADSERQLRYFVSDLLDDLRDPRSPDEMIAAGARLYELLATYVLRRRRLWSAKGKAIPRRLGQVDPELGAMFGDAFAALFAHGTAEPVVRLGEEVLREAGGPLFEGFRIDAPPSWKRRPDSTG
jgi:hypothetical protein